MIDDGESSYTRRNSKRSQPYKHAVEFKSAIGYMAIDFTGTGDYQLDGLIDFDIAKRESEGQLLHVSWYILQNRTKSLIDPSQFAARICHKGADAQPTNQLLNILSKCNLTNHMPKVRWQYRCFYLDETTKKDIVIYYPLNPTSPILYRRLAQVNDSYEFFGKHKNTDISQIMNASHFRQNIGPYSFNNAIYNTNR